MYFSMELSCPLLQGMANLLKVNKKSSMHFHCFASHLPLQRGVFHPSFEQTCSSVHQWILCQVCNGTNSSADDNFLKVDNIFLLLSFLYFKYCLLAKENESPSPIDAFCQV